MRISDWSSEVCSSDRLGYKTERTGKHGAFEVLGPNGERNNREALDGFSKRGIDIKGKAEELGVHSPEGRRAITQRTRDAKLDAGDRTELAERWRAEARDYRYNGDQIDSMELSKSQERTSPIERKEESRVGKEGVRKWKSRWARAHQKKNNKHTQKR